MSALITSLGISIHAPLTGSDRKAVGVVPRDWYFNPRSPYGERRPTASREEAATIFQSTLPLRGATIPGLA